MRAGRFLVGVVVVGLGCGRAPAAKPEGPATAGAGGSEEAREAGDVTDRAAYCKEYGACAREQAFYELQAERGDGAEVPEDRVAEKTRAEVERCERIVRGLTPVRYEWLRACTGCTSAEGYRGGCDVYDCLDRIPEDVSEPFDCDLGGP